MPDYYAWQKLATPDRPCSANLFDGWWKASARHQRKPIAYGPVTFDANSVLHQEVIWHRFQSQHGDLGEPQIVVSLVPVKDLYP